MNKQEDLCIRKLGTLTRKGRMRDPEKREPLVGVRRTKWFSTPGKQAEPGYLLFDRRP